jgi:hypothetical protein
MKFITIQLATVWLFLQATPHFVCGDGLRRSSSSSSSAATIEHALEEGGGDPSASAVVPADMLLHGDDVTANVSPINVVDTMEEDEMRERSLQVTCPTGGKTEVWFGYHPIVSNTYTFYQAKLWVISSDPTKHSIPSIEWTVLANPLWIPSAYKGIKACAKIFTIGSLEGTGSTSKKNLLGVVNNGGDWINPLLSPLLVSSDYDPAVLKAKIDEANTNMNNNFINTNLEYEVMPWDDWYKRGYGWNEFSSNGYISGVLSYLFPAFKFPSMSGYYLGLKKPVPTTFFTTTYSAFTEDELNQKVKNEVYKTQVCTGGNAELWVGRHPVHPVPTKIDWVDHVKLWVISSNVTQHAALGSVWKDLTRERVPDTYYGDKNCAKFFSIGAISNNDELFGGVNHAEDWGKELFGAYRLKSGVDPVSLKTLVDSKNTILNGNFIATSLKHDTAFPRDVNNGAFGWNEFNSNGYIRGLLRSLKYSESGPNGGTMPGWTKPIPSAFFEVSYTTDDQVKQVLGIKGWVNQPNFAGNQLDIFSAFDP